MIDNAITYVADVNTDHLNANRLEPIHIHSLRWVGGGTDGLQSSQGAPRTATAPRGRGSRISTRGRSLSASASRARGGGTASLAHAHARSRSLTAVARGPLPFAQRGGSSRGTPSGVRGGKRGVAPRSASRRGASSSRSTSAVPVVSRAQRPKKAVEANIGLFLFVFADVSECVLHVYDRGQGKRTHVSLYGVIAWRARDDIMGSPTPAGCLQLLFYRRMAGAELGCCGGAALVGAVCVFSFVQWVRKMTHLSSCYQCSQHPAVPASYLSRRSSETG